MKYLDMGDIYPLFNDRNRHKIARFVSDHFDKLVDAWGSSHNHQAWIGGWWNHTLEVMNIAFWLHRSSPREMPFSLSDALEVMFLHDLEKPFKYEGKLYYGLNHIIDATKENRKTFRQMLIDKYEIELTSDQDNALLYVEGVPDSAYSPGERTMEELAAFCHCCDIMSARLWHDKGQKESWDE